METLVEPVAFVCKPLGMETMNERDRLDSLAFQRETAEVQRVLFAALQVLRSAQDQVSEIKTVAERSDRVPMEIRDRARALEITLLDLAERFSGDPTKPQRSEPEMPGLIERLQTVIGGHWSTTQAPTATHRQQLAIVTEALPQLLTDLRKAVESDLGRLQSDLDKMAAPWTNGRKIPVWPPKK